MIVRFELKSRLQADHTADKPCRFSASFCFLQFLMELGVGSQAHIGEKATARAIFLMFWAAAASRHWQATATSPGSGYSDDRGFAWHRRRSARAPLRWSRAPARIHHPI